jgi:hypothetical protein
MANIRENLKAILLLFRAGAGWQDLPALITQSTRLLASSEAAG